MTTGVVGSPHLPSNGQGVKRWPFWAYVGLTSLVTLPILMLVGPRWGTQAASLLAAGLSVAIVLLISPWWRTPSYREVEALVQKRLEGQTESMIQPGSPTDVYSRAEAQGMLAFMHNHAVAQHLAWPPAIKD